MRAQKYLRALWAAWLMVAWGGSAFASFEDTGSGARATGLSSAFTAVADDPYTLFYNPSGLATINRKEFTATYGVLHAGLSDQSRISNSQVIYVHPMQPRFGSMAFSWQQTSLSDLYQERTLALGYAKKVSSYWTMGFNFKQLYRQFTAPLGQTNNFAVTDYTQQDPVFRNGNSRSAWAVDLGYLFRPRRYYSFGMAIQNVNEPNLAISPDDRDPLRAALRAGFSYRQKKHLLTADFLSQKTTGNQRDLFFTLGGEKWWLNAVAHSDVAMRAAVAIGSREYSQWSSGLSLRTQQLQIDYGFYMPLSGVGLGQTYGTHRMTLTFRFGKMLFRSEFDDIGDDIRPMTEADASAAALRRVKEELEAARQESDRLIKELKMVREHQEQELTQIREDIASWKDEIDRTRSKSGDVAATKLLSDRVTQSMNRYWKRKFAGASLRERLDSLTQILREFSGRGADLSVVERELEATKTEYARAEDELELSWNYYIKIAARGASASDRIRLLSRLVERYGKSGLDLSRLTEELERLKLQQ